MLPDVPYTSFDDYRAAGGAKGLDAARAVEPAAVVAELKASGLRGRGGAGFPTGVKWQTVLDHASPTLRTTVVVNAAEGEPGTFKDRTIIRRNPYAVIEGALVAAHVVGASEVLIATKERFTREVARLRAAVEEMDRAGLLGDVMVTVVEGPGEYLYGEETGLLEVLDGRAPLPRIQPPWRLGYVEVVEGSDATPESKLPNRVEMAEPGGVSDAPPALVDNVETMANIPAIVWRGAGWFREVGTERSPGTIVCTVTGDVPVAGVGEFAMGTPLREVLAHLGGGRTDDVAAVMPGVANALVPAELLDTPLTYEDMAAAGSGLGSAGFIVLGSRTDPVAVTAGASRFLAVESCGQCTPCKSDGLAMAAILAALSRGEAVASDLDELRRRVDSVTVEARCTLATQQQVVVASLLDRFPESVAAHLDKRAGADPAVVAELVDIDDQGVATVDERHAAKQPDWTYDPTDSGEYPADRFSEHRAPGGQVWRAP